MKNILLGFIKLILIFISTIKKIKVNNNGRKYILFRIDIYFSNILQQQKLMKDDILTEILFLKEKDKKHQKKKLGCKFIRISTSNAKNGYDLDYEVGNIEAYIDEFKNRKIKELEKKLIEKKEIREMRNEKLKNKNKKINKQLVTNNFRKIIINL